MAIIMHDTLIARSYASLLPRGQINLTTIGTYTRLQGFAGFLTKYKNFLQAHAHSVFLCTNCFFCFFLTK